MQSFDDVWRLRLVLQSSLIRSADMNMRWADFMDKVCILQWWSLPTSVKKSAGFEVFRLRMKSADFDDWGGIQSKVMKSDNFNGNFTYNVYWLYFYMSSVEFDNAYWKLHGWVCRLQILSLQTSVFRSAEWWWNLQSLTLMINGGLYTWTIISADFSDAWS